MSSKKKLFSKTHQHFYWFDESTGETEWELNPNLTTSDYCKRLFEWIEYVMVMSFFRKLNEDTERRYQELQCVFRWNDDEEVHPIEPIHIQTGAILQILGNSWNVNNNPLIQSQLQFETFEKPSQELLTPLQFCPRYPRMDGVFMWLSFWKYSRDEFTLRSLFRFLHHNIKSGGVCMGITFNEETPTTSTSTLHVSTNGQTSIWTFENQKYVLTKFVGEPTVRRIAKEYGFEPTTWKTIHEFYYANANEYMRLFQKHVQYSMTNKDDWKTLECFRVFTFKKL